MSFDAKEFYASFNNFGSPKPDVTSSKKESLALRADEKKSSILEKAARIERNKDSVVSQLGLDPDGIVGDIVNRVAATADTVRDAADGISKLEQAAYEAATGKKLSQETKDNMALPDLDKYVAEMENGVKPASHPRAVADWGITGLKGAINVPEGAVGIADLFTAGIAGKKAEEAGFRSRDAKLLLDSLKSDELRANEAEVHDAKGFVNKLSAAAQNPLMVGHAIGESLPSILAGGVVAKGLQRAGMASKLASAAGEGVVMTGSAAENIRQQTKNGQLTVGQIGDAALTGLLGAAIARVGNKVAGKARVGDIEEAAMTEVLPPAQLAGVPRVAAVAGIEGAEELAQSTEEQILQNHALDKDLLEGVGDAAAMGLVTGSAMGGAFGMAQPTDGNASNGEVLKDLVGSVKDKVGQAADALNLNQKGKDIEAAFEHAKTTGEVDRLVDVKDPAYDPAGAIRAMHEYSQRDDADTEGLIEYGEELVSGMELQLKQRIQNLENSRDLTTPEHIKEQETQIAQTREEVAKMKIALQDWRGTNTDIETLDTNVELANTPVKEITEETAEPVQAAVRKSLTLAMRDSSKMTPEQMEALANNTENSLDDSQRTFLSRSAAARRAIAAAKTLPQVASEVFEGGNGNLGLNNYQTDFDTAHANRDNSGMRAALSGLQKFASAHRSKLDIFSRAFAASEEAGGTKVYSFLPKGAGKWVAAPRGMSWAEVNEKGGVNISAQNSGKLMDALSAEVSALESGLEAMKAKAAMNVPNAPAAKEASAAQPQPKAARSRAQIEAEAEALQSRIDSRVQGLSDEFGALDQKDVLTPEEQARHSELDGVLASISNLHENLDTPYSQQDIKEIKKNLTPEEFEAVRSLRQEYRRIAPAQARAASAPKSEPQAKTEVSTEQASQAVEQPQANFDEEVGIVESGIEQKKQEEAEAREAEEQVRRSEAWLDSRVNAPEPVKSDYLGQTAGKLKALVHKVPAVLNHKNFKFVNLVTSMFKQVGERADSLTPRPLVAVNNFMMHLKNGDVSVNDFLSHEITEAQTPLVSFFMANHDRFIDIINDVVRVNTDKDGNVNSRYFFRTPIDFFRNAEGGFEPNFITALAVSAVAVLAEDVHSPLNRTNEEINSMLGAEEGDAIPASTREALRKMVARRSTFETKLGKFAYEALGLKEKDAKTPLHEKELLQAHLGGHILNVLVRTGMVQLKEVDLKDYFQMQLDQMEGTATSKELEEKKAMLTNANRKDIFITLNRESDFLNELKSISKGTGGILSTLFGIESGQQMPLLAPPKITQEDTNDGKQTITKSVKKAMEKMAKRQLTFRPSMKVLAQASQGFLEDISGIENVDNLVVHKELRDGEQAANDNLRRELEQLMDLWNHLGALGNPFMNFFYRPEQWKNSRIGYTNSWANMQTSKIARFFVAPAGWETTVVPSGKVGKGQSSLNNFKLRVLEGLGAKTDSNSDSHTLATFEEVTGKDTIASAVRVLQRVVDTDLKLTTEEENIVANATKSVGNKLHGFEALWALAQYENAKMHDPVSGQFALKPFTTMVSAEIDGKTNGPMLSMWLLGVIDSSFAAMGGFFTHSSGVRGFGQWKPGNYDLYERTSASVLKRLRNMNISKDRAEALFQLLGSPLDKNQNVTKAGRDLVKNPLTTLIYGSGLMNTVDKMTDVFVENLYKQVAKIHQGDRGQWDAFQKNLKVFTGSKDFLFPETVEEALESPISDQHMALIRSQFKSTVGKAVKETIESDMSGYMTARKQMVRQANVTWGMYQEVRNKLLKDYTEFLMDTGVLPYQLLKDGTVRQPLRTLTREEQDLVLAKIKHMEPRINTALSRRDGDLDSGIFIGKSARKMVSTSELTTDVKGKLGSHTTNHKTRPTISVESSPGVSVMANGVQSTDGNTIVEVLAHLNAIGVHDAILTALHDAAEAGQMMNQQVMDMLLEHSLPRESYEALGRTLKGFADYMRQNPKDMDTEVLGKLLNQLKEGKKDNLSFAQALVRAAQFAHDADYNRLDHLSKMSVVDQYTLESGIFDVPSSFNNKAAKMRDALKVSIDPALMAAAMELDKALFGDNVPGTQKAAPKAQRNTQRTELDLDALLQTPDLTAGVVISQLLNNIGIPQQGDVFGQLYREILKRGARQLKDLPVTYATDESQIPENAKGAYGWYHVDDEGNASIGVRGSNLPGSGITTEMMVHEVLHALVAATIAQAEKGNGSPEVLKAVAELEEMRQFLAPRMTQFGDALKNVQEFVAWGMTNPAFQKAMVAIPHTDKRAPTLLNKAQQFFSTVARIVFGKKAASMDTLFTTFMARVAVIMGDAETNSQQVIPGTQTMAAPQWDALALFEGLGSLGNGYTSQAMQERVAGLMSSVVDAVGGPFQSFYQQAVAGAQSPIAVMATAQANGLMPNSDGLRSSGFALGDQQAFAIEMLTEALHEVQRDTTHEAEKQLVKLFKETSQQVTPADLGGQTQWDALFGAASIRPDGKHLARFAAMALAYPPLANKMGFTTQEVVQKDTTLYGRMVAFFESMMNVLAKMSHKAYAGQRADQKLNTITERLVALEAKYQASMQQSRLDDVMELLEDKADQVGEAVREKLKDASAWLSTSNKLSLKTIGTLGTVVAEQRVGDLLNNVEKLYNRSVSGQMGLMGSLFDELRGTRSSNLLARALLVGTKVREKLRQDIHRDFTRAMTESFARELIQDQEQSITTVLLRNDVQALMGPMTLADIQTLLENPSRLTAEFNRRAAALPPALSTYFLNQIDYIGFMLATGSDKGPNTVRNIENLARLSGTAQADTLSEAEVAALIPELDVLVTLKALSYADEGKRRSMASLMAVEGARQDGGNGIKAVLLMHRELLKQAKARTFVGTERLMVKGYVPEIHNPNIDVIAVDAADVGRKIEAGYKKLYELPLDDSDVYGRPKVLMVAEKMAVRRLSGTLSLVSMQHQGSALHSGIELFDFSGENSYSIHTNKKTAKRRQQEIAALFTRPHGKNLVEDEDVRMTPVMNPMGEVVNYRYMMNHANRDQILERNNHFGQVLGTLASQTFDKETSTDHNSKVIDALHQQWTLEQQDNAEAFIMVGPDSADANLRERYVEIPYETRKLIESVWGGPNMMVRRDLVDLHFGYHKASLVDLLTDNGRYNGMLKDFFLWLGRDVFNIGERGIRRILKAENIIQAMNQEIKDFFVVKSGVTTFWNIVSNMSLLKLHGVTLKEIVRYHRVALKGARDWQKDDSELRRLKAMRDSQYIVGSLQDLDQQIAILEDQLARNPVREVMALGMMPTIAEDMDTMEDPYSYKSYAARKTEKYTQYVPSFVKQGAKWVYMTHDTKLYQIMSQGTQLSDFVARYTLFQHLQNRRKNPLSMAEAAVEAIDSFINYDLPSNRWLQYANDMGIVRFTKYYLRIQAVLMRLYQQNPARAMFLATIENLFDGMQTVMDSTLWNRIGSPLESGPFDAIEALESGLMARALGKVF